MAGQNKASLRRKLRSALAHKRLADKVLDSILDTQQKWNATLVKLNADGAGFVAAVQEDSQVTFSSGGATYDVVGPGLYWTLHDGSNAAHYVWYNVTDGINGPQTDPAPGGTGHQVDILLADLVANLATKTSNVLNTTTEFQSAHATAITSWNNSLAGPATDATAGTADVVPLVNIQGAVGYSTIATNYAATGVLGDIWSADEVLVPGQSRSTARALLRYALAHRKMADEIADALEELQTAYTALLAKLDAEAGLLNDVNYVSTLAVDVLSPSSSALPAQHKATIRRSLISALTNESAADSLLGAVSTLQASFNAALAVIDTAGVGGAMATFEVVEITSDTEG